MRKSQTRLLASLQRRCLKPSAARTLFFLVIGFSCAMAVGDDRSAQTRRSGDSHPIFSLTSNRRIESLLKQFPDLSQATSLRIEDVQVTSIPDALLEKIAIGGKNLRSLSIGIGTSPKRRAAEISDKGMEILSSLSDLQRLTLDCRYSANGLAHLTKLKKLRTLGIYSPTFGVYELFSTVSELPNIRILGVNYADFSQPIDAKTFEAIASLNGRLECLSFGEWQESTIHASMIPAIAEIRSLRSLDLGEVTGSLAEPHADYLKKLPYLERLTPRIPNALAMSRVGTKEPHLVKFRTVTSDSEMDVLLRFLLGRREATKVRREVLRRRTGLSPRREGYPRSEFPYLATILRKEFGVEVYLNAMEILPYITSRYPELDDQIRRYLAGEKSIYGEESEREESEREKDAGKREGADSKASDPSE